TPTDPRQRLWTPRPRAASRGQARSQMQLPPRRTATTCRARELSSHFRSVSARERSSSVLCCWLRAGGVGAHCTEILHGRRKRSHGLAAGAVTALAVVRDDGDRSG